MVRARHLAVGVLLATGLLIAPRPILAPVLSPPEESFIPSDITRAVALGCVVAGDKGPPPFAESQAFVKWTTDNQNWDYRPKISRRSPEQGGVLKAIEDCREWLKEAEKALSVRKGQK